MADRRDYYFRQKVTEAELDDGFAELENADRALALDLGLVGVAFGLAVAQAGTPNMTVVVSGPGAAYDQTGQRCAVPSNQTVNVAVDESALTTAVAAPGNSKILSVFIEFDRALSDPRIDGNSVTVQFVRAESFTLNVAQSAEAVTPTAPPLRSDQILLADITLAYGATTIVNANISTTRRQWMFKTTSGTAVAVGTAEEAIQALATATAAALPLAGGTMTGSISMSGSTQLSYSPARSRTIQIPMASGVAGSGSNWTYGVSNRRWTGTGDSEFVIFPLNEILRDGMVIQQIRAIVDPYDAIAADSDQMQVALAHVAPNYSVPAQPAETIVASQLDDGTSNVQTITIPTIAHTVVRDSRSYYIKVRSQDPGGVTGSHLYALEITVDDPGPRN